MKDFSKEHLPKGYKLAAGEVFISLSDSEAVPSNYYCGTEPPELSEILDDAGEVYWHDTANRSVFRLRREAISTGCWEPDFNTPRYVVDFDTSRVLGKIVLAAQISLAEDLRLHTPLPLEELRKFCREFDFD